MFLLLLCGCAGTGEQSADIVSSRVIYGADDREELAQSEYAGLGTVAIALIPTASLEASAGDADSNWPGLGAPLADQRYADQPSAAICGGVAIGGEYVLTASHCVPDRAACHRLTFVRGYALDDAGRLGVDQLDKYDCDDVVLSVKSDVLAPEAFDFSIVRLARPIADLSSGSLGISAATMGERAVCVAPISGLPLKVTTGEVLDVDAAGGFFHASVDFFAGGSGSGLFNERGELLGIMVAGSSDYVEGPDGCLSVRIIDSRDVGSGELGNDLGAILDYACDRDGGLPFCAAAQAGVVNSAASGAAEQYSQGRTPTNCALTSARRDVGSSSAWALVAVGLLVVGRIRQRARRIARPRRSLV